LDLDARIAADWLIPLSNDATSPEFLADRVAELRILGVEDIEVLDKGLRGSGDSLSKFVKAYFGIPSAPEPNAVPLSRGASIFVWTLICIGNRSDAEVADFLKEVGADPTGAPELKAAAMKARES
jgi:hypothetical protein